MNMDYFAGLNLLAWQLYPDRALTPLSFDANDLSNEPFRINRIIKFLLACKNIDWLAYLDNYQDVKESGMNPVSHFARFGLLENRKLYFKEPVPANITRLPILSIIVPNHNNGIFLKQSIGSLLGQTYRDIEIIIIDDGSTDNSAAVLEKLARQDNRIRLIKFPENLSQHMARKIGAFFALGDYAMFLDPDDFFTTNACEIALEAITRGYDIVNFGINVITTKDIPEAHRRRALEYLNKGDNREYGKEELFTALIRHQVPTRVLWNKIYKTDIVKRAFNLMQNGFYPAGQDIYEIVVIASLAESMLKIPDKLYYYRIGTGCSTIMERDYFTKSALIATRVAPLVEDYLYSCSRQDFCEPIMRVLHDRALNGFLALMGDNPDETYTDYLGNLFRNLSLDKFLYHCLGRRKADLPRLAEQSAKYLPSPAPASLRHIAILVTLKDLDTYRLFYFALFDFLKNVSCRLTVFTNGQVPYALVRKPDFQHIEFLHWKTANEIGQISSFIQFFSDADFDLILSFLPLSPMTFLHAFIARQYNLPIFIFLLQDIFSISFAAPLTFQYLLSSLRNYTAVFTSNLMDNRLLGNFNINTVWMPCQNINFCAGPSVSPKIHPAITFYISPALPLAQIGFLCSLIHAVLGADSGKPAVTILYPGNMQDWLEPLRQNFMHADMGHLVKLAQCDSIEVLQEMPPHLLVYCDWDNSTLDLPFFLSLPSPLIFLNNIMYVNPDFIKPIRYQDIAPVAVLIRYILDIYVASPYDELDATDYAKSDPAFKSLFTIFQSLSRLSPVPSRVLEDLKNTISEFYGFFTK